MVQGGKRAANRLAALAGVLASRENFASTVAQAPISVCACPQVESGQVRARRETAVEIS